MQRRLRDMLCLPACLLLMSASSVAKPTIGTCFTEVFGDNGTYVHCPRICPYAVSCTSGATRCVRTQDCPVIFSGGSHSTIVLSKSDTGVCYNCKSVGCHVCADNKRCLQCNANFDLDAHGSCVWVHQRSWFVALGCMGLLALWVLTDFLRNLWLPDQNPGAVKHGLQHRCASKVRELNKSNEPLYPLSVNVHCNPICGPGMTLFFNWFAFLFLVALWLALISAIFQFKGSSADQNLRSLCDSVELKNASNRNSSLSVSGVAVGSAPKSLILWTGLAYFGVLVLSLAFCFFQHRLSERLKQDEDSCPMLHSFTVEASGFPEDAIDQESLKAWWQQVVDEIRALEGEAPNPSSADVVEVSVGYSYSDETSEVTRLIDDHLHAEECLHGEYLKADEARIDQDDFDDQDSGSHTFWVQFMSFAMLGTDMNTFGLRVKGWDPTPPAVSRERACQMLSGLRGSTRMFVVFQTRKVAQMVLRYPTLPLMWGEYDITTHYNPSEPLEIQWESFSITDAEHNKTVIVSACLMPFIIAVWGLLYSPWAEFSLNAAAGASGMVKMAADQFLSGVIGVGNCVISYAAVLVTSWYGFRHKANMQQAYLLIIVPGVLLNVIVDVVVTWKVVFKENENFTAFDGDPKFFWSHGMDSIFTSIFGLLIPSYILVPYVLEPFFTVFLPFWLGLWRVKSDKSISKQHAERILISNEVDIVNPAYTDMICTTSVFCWTLWSPHSKHWQLFLAMAFFIVLLYWQTRIRILRWQSRSFFGSAKLSRVQGFLWSIPLGILAANFGSQLADISHPWKKGCFGIGFGALHVIVHCLALKCVFVWRDGEASEEVIDNSESYSEAIGRHPMRATYRNTNPIEVLLSRQTTVLVPSAPSAKPLIYYMIGKDYLQQAGTKPYYGEESNYELFAGHEDSESEEGECDAE